MITIETTRSGHKILKSDGKFLGSSVDPVREAKGWFDRLAGQRKDLKSRSQIVILGMGSGYHVNEVRGRGHKALVIEPDAEILRLARETCPDTASVEVIHEINWMSLLENPRFRTLIQDVFVIAPYGPSVQLNETYFTSVEKLLVARDRTSFFLQLKMRPELYGLLDNEKLAALKSGETISIKNLPALFKDQANATEERRLWRILEELIV